MNVKRAAWLPLVLAMASAGCGGEGSDPTNSSAEIPGLGRSVYVATCASCHGGNGEGVPGLGSSLIGGEFGDSSDQVMRQVIIDGQDATDPGNTMGVAMPAKGGNPRLSDEEVDAVLAYLRDLQP